MTLIWLLHYYSCWRAAELQEPPSPFSDHLHPSMCPPFVSPFTSPSFVSFPFLFSSIHYQEGQPVEAPVSPTPSQQGLEAAAAATVSELKLTIHHILFKEVANSAAEFFVTLLRAWDLCILESVFLLLIEMITEKMSTSYE